jgi:hypothetical protein
VKRSLHSIVRLVLAFLPVLLALAQAKGQQGVDTVYSGQSTVQAVVEFEGVTYSWELYKDVTNIDFATDPGNCPPAEAYFVGGINIGSSVEIMWAVPGTYFFKVTAADACTDNLKVGKKVVLESMSEAEFLEPDPICQGDTAIMTIVITGGIGPWEVTFTDGITVWTVQDIMESPYSFPLIPSPAVPGNYPYWITSVTSGTGMVNDTPSDPVILIVHPKPVTSPIYRY